MNRPLFAFATLLLAATTFAATSFAADKEGKDKEKDSLDRDYAGELPRIAPLSPTGALAAFQVAKGYRIELVAAEPLVVDPIAMAFDEDGRLYVVEMRDYSEDDKANLGRIRLLIDKDGDGRFDESHIFADKLSWPTAVFCYDGGVFVGAPPDLYYLKDTDGDHIADVKELVYTGFSRANVQGMLNSFHWGPDNRIHVSTSSNGGDIRPGNAGADANATATVKPFVLRGRDLAFDPKSRALFATSGGGQHGMTFNSWGEKFVCSNSDHVQQVMFEDRYVARNPYVAAPSARVSIAPDGPQADTFRTSPVEPWRLVRTRLRKQGLIPGPVERGGLAAGYFTSATGLTIFRGTSWPAADHDWAIVADVGSNLIHRKRLDRDGVGYIARRVDEKSEFITSTDVWFRPVQFANAPDGGLYITDMYREVVEHPASLHPIIKKHLDLTSGRDRGRIYRVVGDGFKQPKLPQLGRATTAELVTTLGHENGWHRDTALRLLYERQDRSAIPLLRQLANEAKSPLGRIGTLCALDGLTALTPDVLAKRLADEHPRVREHAVRLAEKLTNSAVVRDSLYALADDSDLRVRYQLAFTLGELSGPERNRALFAILKRDGEDRFVRVAVYSSLADGAGDVLTLATNDAAFRQSSSGQRVLRDLAGQIGKQQRADDVAAVLRTLSSLPADEAQTLQAVIQGLAAKPGSPLEMQISLATKGRSAELVRDLLAKARDTATKLDDPIADRVDAVLRLQLGSFADQQALLQSLLEPAQPDEVQAAALKTLGSYTDAGVAPLLVASWRTLTPRIRARAGDVLFSRAVWLSPLLDAIERKKIAPGDLEPGRLTLLASHRDESIRRRAAALVALNKTSPRDEVLVAYQDVVKMPGDAERGKAVFKKVCASCHQVEGVGFAIGPNLAAMRTRGSEAILTNVLVPNREVNPQYLNYVLITKDGRSLSGLISAETATSVTLRRADNAADTVLRIDIDELRSTGQSLMPEGLEKLVDKPAMADLLAYLNSLP